MARDAIKGEFRTSYMADRSEKWPEMRSKVILPIKKIYRSEMTRIAIESEFRTAKMADLSHLVKNIKKIKLHIDLKWPPVAIL